MASASARTASSLSRSAVDVLIADFSRPTIILGVLQSSVYTDRSQYTPTKFQKTTASQLPRRQRGASVTRSTSQRYASCAGPGTDVAGHSEAARPARRFQPPCRPTEVGNWMQGRELNPLPRRYERRELPMLHPAPQKNCAHCAAPHSPCQPGIVNGPPGTGHPHASHPDLRRDHYRSLWTASVTTSLRALASSDACPVKWSRREDLHLQGCRFLKPSRLLFRANHAASKFCILTVRRLPVRAGEALDELRTVLGWP